MEVLGLDIGGTGIKGALVNTDTGEMLTERYRLLTPQPSTPKAMKVWDHQDGPAIQGLV